MKSLKALIIEDSKDDAALLLRHLFNEGYDVQSKVLQTSADMKIALDEDGWDIILSDYSMPHFSGLEALSVLKQSGLDIPFIVISGTIGEDVAVEAMILGVDDYLMKGNLVRLARAIEREMDNAAVRRAQKKAEESLRRSEDNLANAQRIAHIGSWETDLVNNQLFWSDEVYRIFDVSKDDFGDTLESFMSFIHPADRQSVQDAAEAALTRNAPYNIEHRIITGTGVERIVCEIGEITFDAAGKPVRMIGTVQDITERKQAAAALKLSEAKFNQLVESSLIGIIITKLDGSVIEANDVFLEMVGYGRAELLAGKVRWDEMTPPEFDPETERKTVSEFGISQPHEKEYIRKDGQRISVLGGGTLVKGSTDTIIAFALDISEKKRAEKDLEKALKRERALIENALDVICTIDAEGKFASVSPASLKVWGYRPEELIGRPYTEIVVPEDAAKTDEAAAAIMSGVAARDFENCYRHKSGSIVHIRWTAFWSDTEQLMFCVAHDITDRKRAEEEKLLLIAQIEQQHERLDNILANVPGVVWEAWGKPDDATQRIDFVSDYVETLLGYTVEEWVTTPNFWLSIVHPDDKEWIGRATAENFLAGKDYTRQFRWVAKDGRVIWVESQATVIRDEAGQPIGLRGVNIDITERKRLENERTQLIAELNFEKARLQHIFDNSPSFIVSMRGPDYVFETVNPAYYKLVGQRQLIGLPAREALPELADQGFLELLNRVYTTGEPFIGSETPARLKPLAGEAEEQVYINFVYMPMRDADGAINGILSYGVDVTEQVLARITVQESEERYRLLFDNSPLPMWVFDSETLRFLSVNEAAINHYGYSREEFLRMSLKDIRLPEDFPALAEFRAKDFLGIRKVGVVRHRNKGGAIIYADIITNQFIFDGREAKLVLVNDVTERRKAEESVRFQAHLLDVVEQSVIATDLDGNVIYWNQFAENLYGWTAAEAVGRHVKELTTPEINFEQANQIMVQLKQGKSWTGEFVVQNKAGESFPAYISNSPVNDDSGKIVGIVGVSVDITERKRAERQIIESEEKYRIIVETANEGIWLADIESVTIYVNRRMAEMLGYTVDEMIGRPIFDFIFEEDLSTAQQKVTQRIKGESETNEFRLRRKDGSKIIMQYNASPIRNQAGEIVGFLSMNTDITERNRAETALREAEDKYRRLIESSPGIIYLNEPNPPYSTIYVSPSAEILGYSIEEWYTTPGMWANLLHKEDRDRVLREFKYATEHDLETDLEYRVLGRDGTVYWWQDKGHFVSDGRKNRLGWQGIILDITKTKSLEAQLRQSQKLESVGRLAGGIAHDFNNMLTAINGYSELTLRKLQADSPLRRNIEEIKKAGERSALLTHQLLAFSRRQVLKPVVLHLNEVITDTIKLLERLIGEDVKLVTKLDSKTGRVNVDPGQLSQIIMNLAVNARDAMPQGGQLTIETANVFLEPEYTRQKIGVLPGAYVLMTVSDTGQGMDDKTQQQIFEPFFTTKELGKGTGLGLATVYGIIKQSAGDIEFDSKVGVGTTFRIYLPRVVEQPEAVEKIDTSAKFLNGSETILLVEDEELVRKLARKMLETCGYAVIEARDGLEALKIFDAGDCKPDLLLTDVVMPQMGGRELAEKLTKKLPNIKILFTSGYTDDAVIRQGVIKEDTNFIQKPFTFDGLNSKIRELLDDEG